jgi:bacillithiol biosynthesis cysteine-adding enzyme BshC
MYKILHVIRLCEELNAEQQEIHFVPVFWLAGEDHDFEEMRSMKLFQSEIGLDEKLGGAFGRYPFASVEELKEQVASFFQNSESNEIDELLNNYKGATIVEATQSLFHYLFGDKGLIVLDPDRKELKHLFSPIMAEELRNQRAFNAMNADKDRFLASGLKAQAHPRAINLFYLGDYSRQRIEQVEADFFIEGKGSIQQSDLLEELKTDPERFSPNVILRPLYQEVLLPNVCYVGGVGELAYWLQLSPVFKAFNIDFPLIQPRCSVAIIEKRWEKKLSRSGLAMEDFFRPLERIKSERTEKAAADNFDFHPLNAANAQLREATEALFNGLDQNAVRNISKELHHCEEAIQRMIQSVLRSVKGKQEQELKDLDQLFQGVFPGGSMQERAVSFLQFCSDGKMKQRLNQIRDLIDPFDPDFIFIKE